jgi:hypothetical protein
MNFTEELKPISGDEFGELFSSFTKEAFRLEMLQVFSIPEEQAEISTFASGVMKPPRDFNKEWHDLIAAALSRGAAFKRVRMIESPLTLYTKYEIAWGYFDNISAGEDIRVVDKKDTRDFAEYVPALLDYWLFDEKTCVLMSYDLEGRYLGAHLLPERYLDNYIKLKNHAMSVGRRLKDTPFANRDLLIP